MKKFVTASLLALIVCSPISSVAATLGSTPSSSRSTSAYCRSLGSKDLATHIRSQIDGRIAQASASEAKAMWSTMATTLTGSWVRNPNVWTSKGKIPLDFSGVSAFNSHPTNGYPYRQAGTLVSPRHVLMAAHYPVQVGARMVFVDSRNRVVTRTLVARKDIVLPSGSRVDISVGVLDADLPDTVAYYPVMNVEDFAKKTYKVDNLQPEFSVISLNKQDEPFVRASDRLYNYQDINTSSRSGSLDIISFGHTWYTTPTIGTATYPHIKNTPERIRLSGNLVDGDSGHPNFTAVNDSLVLLGVHSGASSAVFAGAHMKEINAVMNELGGGYQLTTVNLDCFDNYKLNHAPSYKNLTGLYKDLQTGNNYDDASGYLILPVGTGLDSKKPFIKFEPFDVDRDKVKVTVTDTDGLLAFDKRSNSVYFKKTPVFKGTNRYGVTDGDIVEFTVTLTDDNKNKAETTISDGFVVKNNSLLPMIDVVSQNSPVRLNTGGAFNLEFNSNKTGTHSLQLVKVSGENVYNLDTYTVLESAIRQTRSITLSNNIPNATYKTRVCFGYGSNLSGCDDSSSTIELTPPNAPPVIPIVAQNTTIVAPRITSIIPSFGPFGTSMTITGTGFTPTGNRISTSGVIANVVPRNSDGTLTFVIPAYIPCESTGGTTCTPIRIEPGRLAIIVGNSNGTSGPATFTVTQNTTTVSPTITSLQPTSGRVGSTVNLAGTGFTNTNNTILIDDRVALTVPRTTSTSLSFVMPESIPCPSLPGLACYPLTVIPGAHTIKVQNSNGTTNSMVFTVTIPTPAVPAITSINPSSGIRGSRVTVNGTGFTATGNRVKFGNMRTEQNPLYNVVSADGRTLSFNVPLDDEFCFGTMTCPAFQAPTPLGVHNISIINANGTSGGVNYTVTAPTIINNRITSSTINTRSVRPGDTVTFNFTTTQSLNSTTFFAEFSPTNVSGPNLIVPLTKTGSGTTQTTWTGRIPTSARAGIYEIDIADSANSALQAFVGNLTITAPPVDQGSPITITSPDGTRGYTVGDVVNIRWTSVGLPSDQRATISLFKNGSHVRNLASGALVSSGSLNWTIPDGELYASGNVYDIYIGATTVNGTKSDHSEMFSINYQTERRIDVNLQNHSYTFYNESFIIPFTWNSTRPVRQMWLRLIEKTTGQARNARSVSSATDVVNGSSNITFMPDLPSGVYELSLCDMTGNSGAGITSATTCGEEEIVVTRVTPATQITINSQNSSGTMSYANDLRVDFNTNKLGWHIIYLVAAQGRGTGSEQVFELNGKNVTVAGSNSYTHDIIEGDAPVGTYYSRVCLGAVCDDSSSSFTLTSATANARETQIANIQAALQELLRQLQESLAR